MAGAEPEFCGLALWLLGDARQVLVHEGSLKFGAGAPGTYWYLDPCRASLRHALRGQGWCELALSALFSPFAGSRESRRSGYARRAICGAAHWLRAPAGRSIGAERVRDEYASGPHKALVEL